MKEISSTNTKLSVVSFIFGILALTLAVFSVTVAIIPRFLNNFNTQMWASFAISFVFGLTALITGIIGLKKEKHIFSVIGICVGIISMLAAPLWMLALGIVVFVLLIFGGLSGYIISGVT